VFLGGFILQLLIDFLNKLIKKEPLQEPRPVEEPCQKSK